MPTWVAAGSRENPIECEPGLALAERGHVWLSLVAGLALALLFSAQPLIELAGAWRLWLLPEPKAPQQLALFPMVLVFGVSAAIGYGMWRVFRQKRDDASRRARLARLNRRLPVERVLVHRTRLRRGKGSVEAYLLLGTFAAPDGRYYVAVSDPYSDHPGERIALDALRVLCDPADPRQSLFVDQTLPVH